jgi:hypothetical protein
VHSASANVFPDGHGTLLTKCASCFVSAYTKIEFDHVFLFHPADSLLALHVLDDELLQLIWLVSERSHSTFVDDSAVRTHKICPQPCVHVQPLNVSLYSTITHMQASEAKRWYTGIWCRVPR